MKMSDIVCRLCGENCMQASERGAYLERVNPKGVIPMVMECRPSCGETFGTQEDAVISAITGDGS